MGAFCFAQAGMWLALSEMLSHPEIASLISLPHWTANAGLAASMLFYFAHVFSSGREVAQLAVSSDGAHARLSFHSPVMGKILHGPARSIDTLSVPAVLAEHQKTRPSNVFYFRVSDSRGFYGLRRPGQLEDREAMQIIFGFWPNAP
jgi:hypothetical protein